MFCKQAALCAAFALLSACSRQIPGDRNPARLAILSFENLSSDRRADWVGPALAFLIAAQTNGVRGLSVRHFGDSRSAALFDAARSISGYYVASGDRLDLHIWFRDERSGRTGRILNLTASPLKEVVSIPDRIAREIHAAAKPPLTRSFPSLQSFGQALISPPGENRIQWLRESIQADPAFDEARLMLARDLTALQRFAEAAVVFRELAQRQPGIGAYWNELAYAQARAGDFEAALESIRRYEDLDKGPNPLDSRGEILFMQRKYAEAAASFLEAYERSPDFLDGAPLRKAAEATLRAGDLQRADELFQRYLQKHRKGSMQEAPLRARWQEALKRAKSR